VTLSSGFILSGYVLVPAGFEVGGFMVEVWNSVYDETSSQINFNETDTTGYYSVAVPAGTNSMSVVLPDGRSLPIYQNSLVVSGNMALNVTIFIPPGVSASPDTIDQGQTSILTSSYLTTGFAPYSYQWFEVAPDGSIFTVGSNSASFSFVTSNATETGAWDFYLQVTDATGAAVNSTAASVTVNQPNSPASISISANPTQISENPLQSSTITVTVLDKNGNQLQGFQVSFTTTSGVLTSPSLTDSQGQTQVTLTPTSETSTSITVSVTASIGNVQNSTTLTFEPPAYIFSISTNPTSATISPGGSASTTVTVTSPLGTSESVGIFATGYPPNSIYTVKPAGGSTPYSSTFTVLTNGYTSGNPTPAGVYIVSIHAVLGQVVETTNFTVTVTGTNTITIYAGTGGSVTYTYNGNSGVVQSGQSTQVKAQAGSQISLTAIPDSQHQFHMWTTTAYAWTATPAFSTTMLNVAGDGSVTANFNSNSVTIFSGNGGQITYIAPAGSGTLTSAQQTTIQVDSSNSISLGAIPNYGYSFQGWSSSSTAISIANPSQQSTTATVNGAGTITANFKLNQQVSASVIFTESGLATGVLWSVNFNGQTATSASTSISFPVTSNAQYPWSISPPNGYTTSTSSGTATVNGASINQQITFQKQTQSKTQSSTTVTCTPTTIPANSATQCTATITGSNPTGTITWTSSSATGNFNTATSSLTSGTSSVTYTDTNTGVATITATYSGDSNNSPSNSAASVTVSGSQTQYINIGSQYTGYFFEYLPIQNTFSVFTSLSGASPITVYGVVDGKTYYFSNPSSQSGPYTLTLNMGSLTPDSSLQVYADYSGGKALTASYPLQIIDTPSWLYSIITFYQGQDEIDVGPISIQQTADGYTATLSEDLNFSSILPPININLPSFAGGGTYNIIPNPTLEISFSSNGNLQLSAKLSHENEDLSFGPLDASASIEIEASGNFQLNSNCITWNSATLSLTVGASASQDIPIAGYTVNIPIYGPVTIGFTATVSIDANFAVNMILSPTTDSTKELFSGLQIMLQQINGEVSFDVGLAINAGIGIGCVTGQGTLTFMVDLNNTSPYITGGSITGTVEVDYNILGWDGILYSAGPGTIYQWPTGTTTVDPSDFTLTPPYYNASYYESPTWINGSLAGIALRDIYPFTRITASSNGDNAYILYTTDNLSAPQQYGLSLTGFTFNSRQKTMQPITLPTIANEILFNPVLTTLPNGNLLAMWDSVSVNQIASASSPFDITQIIPQYSIYNTLTGSWGPITSLTASGITTSYALSYDPTNAYALILQGNGIFATTQSLVEYNLNNNAQIISVSVANVSNVVAFNALSDMAILQNTNGSYQLLNLASQQFINLPAMDGYNIQSIQFAQNSPNTLGILYTNPASAAYSIYDYSSNNLILSLNVSQSTSSVNLIQLPSGYQIITADASGITSYLIVNQSLQQSMSYPMPNITSMGTTVTNQGTLVYLTQNYGNSTDPLLNLAMILTTNSILAAPSLTPSRGTIDQGQTSTLTSSAMTTGASPYTYQWFEMAPGGNFISAGTNSASFNFATSSSTTAGTYSFIIQVTDNNGVAVNSTAINVAVNTAPTVSITPTSTTFNEDQSKTFTANPNSGSGTYPSYQWYINGVAQTGKTTSTFTYTPTSAGSPTITVTVTDSLGAVSSQSNAPSVTVNLALSTPTGSVSATTINQGDSSTLSITSLTGGTTPYSYQWLQMAPGAIGYSIISSATSSNYTFTTTTSTSTGTWTFELQVTDSTGTTVNSTASAVTVNTPSPNPTPTPAPTAAPTTAPTSAPISNPTATPVPHSSPTPSPTPAIPETPAALLIIIIAIGTSIILLTKKRFQTVKK
jgi:hypothetical protein